MLGQHRHNLLCLCSCADSYWLSTAFLTRVRAEGFAWINTLSVIIAHFEPNNAKCNLLIVVTNSLEKNRWHPQFVFRRPRKFSFLCLLNILQVWCPSSKTAFTSCHLALPILLCSDAERQLVAVHTVGHHLNATHALC